MLREAYIKTLIEYSRKFPSSSDKLITQMANKQFSQNELDQLWNQEKDGKS